MITKKLIQDLNSHTSEKRRVASMRFFKMGKGEYSYNDNFIGISMPDIRKVIKNYINIDFPELKTLLYSPYHEIRMSALLILTENAKKSTKKNDLNSLKKITEFYLNHKEQVNNWDLVDASTHYILGASIIKGIYNLETLEELAKSDTIWDRRIAMVSTWLIIRTGDIHPTLVLAKMLLKDKQDLMHKAVGWMLREAWKKEPKIIENFLIENYHQIHRTTLRYSIEKMEETKRKKILYLNKNLRQLG